MKERWNFRFLLHLQSHKFECVLRLHKFFEIICTFCGFSAQQLFEMVGTFTMAACCRHHRRRRRRYCLLRHSMIPCGAWFFYSYVIFRLIKEPQNANALNRLQLAKTASSSFKCMLFSSLNIQFHWIERSKKTREKQQITTNHRTIDDGLSWKCASYKPRHRSNKS